MDKIEQILVGDYAEYVFGLFVATVAALYALGPVKFFEIFRWRWAAGICSTFYRRPRTILSEKNNPDMVIRGILRDIKSCKVGDYYQLITCHTTPQIIQAVLADFKSALRLGVRIQIVTANEVFGIQNDKGEWSHPLVELLKQNMINFSWRVLPPPVFPHMRISPRRVIIEHPHGFDHERYFDYYQDNPLRVLQAKQEFMQVWSKARRVVEVEKDVRVLDKNAQDQIKEQFKAEYEKMEEKFGAFVLR